MRQKPWVLLLLVLPVAFLIPYLGEFILPPNSMYSDLLISHLPNAEFIRQSLSQWGQIPLWSPTILSGYPFFAVLFPAFGIRQVGSRSFCRSRLAST